MYPFKNLNLFHLLLTIPYIFFVLVISDGKHLASAETKSHDKNTTEQILKTEDGETIIECSGTILPRHHYKRFLQPGEYVKKCLVQTGMVVEKDSILFEIGNDDLTGTFISLQEKLMAVEKQDQQGDLLKTKAEIIKNGISRIEQNIENERKIQKQIPGYSIEEKIKEWIIKLNTKKDELKITNKTFELWEKDRIKSNDLQKQLQDELALLKKRIDRLLIKAPFKGRIIELNPFPDRLLPGELILSMWDDQSFEVKANAWQHHIPHIIPGTRVKILTDGFSKAFIWGKVRSIGDSGSPMEKGGFPFFPIFITMENPIKELKAGMVVTVKIMVN